MTKRRMHIVVTLVLLAAMAVSFSHAAEPQSQTRTLSGRVVGGQDDPLAKAIVYLKDTKTLAVKTYISDADGGYHFPALSTNVDYELYAEYQGARSDTKTVSTLDNRKNVYITLRVKR
jgi:Carboxypeptidase regulatory-like domain